MTAPKTLSRRRAGSVPNLRKGSRICGQTAPRHVVETGRGGTLGSWMGARQRWWHPKNVPLRRSGVPLAPGPQREILVQIQAGDKRYLVLARRRSYLPVRRGGRARNTDGEVRTTRANVSSFTQEEKTGDWPAGEHRLAVNWGSQLGPLAVNAVKITVMK